MFVTIGTTLQTVTYSFMCTSEKDSDFPKTKVFGFIKVTG